MKYVTFFFILLPMFLHAQKIDGVGPFMIGKTTTSIIDSLRNNHYEYAVSDNIFNAKYEFERNYGTYRLEQKIYKLENKPGELKYQNSVIPEHSKYIIDKVSISKIDVTIITLDFYKDTLYCVTIDNGRGFDDFAKAIRIKYGDPKPKTVVKKIECTGRIAGNFSVEETAYTITFRNDNLSAFQIFDVYYDDECRKKYSEYFKLFDKKVSAFVDVSEGKYKKDFEARKEKEDKQKLKDF